MRHFLLIFISLMILCACSVVSKPCIIGIAEERDPVKVTAMRTYVDAVSRSGNIPMVIPDSKDPGKMKEALKKVDVLLLIGGEDVDPKYYGAAPSEHLGDVNPQRDTFEMALLGEAVKIHKPIFGICRGIQMINVFFGGDLYQDLPSEYHPQLSEYKDTLQNHSRSDMKYSAVHGIVIDKDSRLYKVLQVDSVGVNSTHHQAVKTVAPGFKVTARSTDGVIEGIESLKYPVAAVQFHPERLARDNDTLFTRIFSMMKALSGD